MPGAAVSVLGEQAAASKASAIGNAIRETVIQSSPDSLTRVSTSIGVKARQRPREPFTAAAFRRRFTVWLGPVLNGAIDEFSTDCPCRRPVGSARAVGLFE